MQATALSEDTGEQVRLPAVLDLAAADGFLDLLQAEAEQNGNLHLDGAGVEILTMPCIQIILAAIRSHRGVSIFNPSAEFQAAFNDLGLDWKRSAKEESGDDLRSAAAQVELGGPVDAPDPLQDQPSDTAMKKRILTIDDSKTMREMLMVTLADAGFDVIQGVDGQDGLNALGDDRVDVVITDINMPKMDGYEVIRQLRRNPVHKATPILVLTTESDAEKRNLARTAGATGWMVKPFDPEQLVATVRKVSP